MGKPCIYLAGDMLTRGAQLQRTEEKETLKALGYPLYVPQDNKSINDKANLNSNKGLAEKIVHADTQGINMADIIVMEAREGALGTCMELGQIKGQRDFASRILGLFNDMSIPSNQKAGCVVDVCRRELAKQILVHNSDIRRGGNPTETGDRRSYGPHQYMYGVVLDVTGGIGYREWEDIVIELLNSNKE